MKVWGHRGSSTWTLAMESHDITDPHIHAEKPISLVVRNHNDAVMASWGLSYLDLARLHDAITRELDKVPERLRRVTP